ncbi:MAG: HAD-IC family P-type ATPase, partial [Armatimonadetes bacterium]|nr:HAD-IC family P-type ATPase [Armatimonadota bacterium]
MHKLLTLNCSCDVPCRHGAISVGMIRVTIAGVFMLIAFALKALKLNETLSTCMLVIAVLTVGMPIAISAARTVLKLRFNIQALMTIAIIGAIAIGELSEAAVVLLLFAIAELLEEMSAQRARDALRQLFKLAPNEATVRRDGEEVRLNVDDVRIGEIVIVKPGERIPIDGIVLSGQAHVNQAPITGEHIPVMKTPGSDVFAGSINVDGAIEIKATRTASESTIARIGKLVEQAELHRAPIERFVDKFANYYTPAVIAIAACIAIFPTAFGYGAFETWLYRALVLLVISCPCALVISTPVAMVCSLTAAARNGVLIKGGIHVEQLASVKV